jgi:hypothetical protein
MRLLPVVAGRRSPYKKSGSNNADASTKYWLKDLHREICFNASFQYCKETNPLRLCSYIRIGLNAKTQRAICFNRILQYWEQAMFIFYWAVVFLEQVA